MSRTARTGAVLSGAALTLVLSAGPALAEHNRLAPLEGADPHAGMSIGQALLIFGLVPLVLLVGVAALVWLPGVMRGGRYRPNRGWSAPPVWFGGPADPVAAVESAESGGTQRGGASGDW